MAGDVAMVNMAAEIKIRAERMAGELLGEMDLQDGARGQGKKVESHDATSLADLGIDKHESSRWQKVASVPTEEFDAYVQQTKADGRELTSSGVRKLAKQSATEQRKTRILPTCLLS